MRRTLSRSRGFSLIELMIGLLLGLIVVAAAIGIFISNSHTQRATESLGRIAENARVAYELMARDIREAGGNICPRGLPVVNVLNNAGAVWWSTAPGVRGYDGAQAFPEAAFGTGAGQRLAGTDAIEVVSAAGSGLTVVSHNPPSAQFQVNLANHDLAAGDILIACSLRQVSIFQMTGPNATNNTVVHNTGGGHSPGNCSKGLGFAHPVDCSTTGRPYAFGANSQIAELRAVRWYVANNGRGGRSLYQAALRNNGGAPAVAAEEVAEGITDLQFEYLPIGGTAYLPATAVTDWGRVAAVRVTVTLQGGQGAIVERVGTDGAVLQRQFTHVVALRNRLP